jgi:hypothetical protein
MVFNTTFNNNSDFIGGGNQSTQGTPPNKQIEITNHFIKKANINLYPRDSNSNRYNYYVKTY